MIKELKTAHLTLRQLGFEDLYDFYERLMSDGEVTKYLSFDPHQDIGESLQLLESCLQRYDRGDCHCWAIEDPEDGLIGIVELTELSMEEKRSSFRCMLAKHWWGRGYATEALGAVLDFATRELGITKITADHMAPNAAAGRVMEKAGMKKAGLIPGKYEKHGLSRDAVVYELDLTDAEPLTANEYQKLAMATLNPELTKKDVLINGVMGLCGESGECIDLVKKHLHQGHSLDREKLSKELGDVAWYLAETAWALDLKLEDILRGNLEKLLKRYPKGFDPEKSVNR